MKNLNLKNIVWKEGKHFVARCINFDIASFGNNKKEALKNLKEAVELYLENSELEKNFREIDQLEIVCDSLNYI